MEPKNYDKEILQNREEPMKPFQNFTDGFVGAMALVGIITIGYQLVKLFISLV